MGCLGVTLYEYVRLTLLARYVVYMSPSWFRLVVSVRHTGGCLRQGLRIQSFRALRRGSFIHAIWQEQNYLLRITRTMSPYTPVRRIRVKGVGLHTFVDWVGFRLHGQVHLLGWVISHRFQKQTSNLMKLELRVRTGAENHSRQLERTHCGYE